jgi:hypothetical protein
MAKRSEIFKAFLENLEEHARIERVVASSMASMDETTSRGRKTVAETRDLLAKANKLQTALSAPGRVPPGTPKARRDRTSRLESAQRGP